MRSYRPNLETLEVRLAPAVPDQFVEKVFTDALGRLPDPGGWASAENWFIQNPSVDSISGMDFFARNVFTSAEYGGLGYDAPAKVLTLYRSILSREPDPAGFANWLSYLNVGGSLASAVDAFFASAEMANLSQKILSPTTPAYGWGASPPIDISVNTVPPLAAPNYAFNGNDLNALQSFLNSVPAPAHVFVAPAAVFRVGANVSLVIPSGVTLSTYGVFDHNEYAEMARVVRDHPGTVPVVTMSGGSTLQDIWIDGEAGRWGLTQTAFNVEMFGGSTVQACVFTDTSGGASINLGSEFNGSTGDTVSTSLITQYVPSGDGIRNYCPTAQIFDNQLADASDVSIADFGVSGKAQASRITGNVIFNGGNPSSAALAIVPVGSPNTENFAGGLVDSNCFWTSSRAWINIGLALGLYPWSGAIPSYLSSGIAVEGNFIPSGVQSGGKYFMAVSGMINATVFGNADNGGFRYVDSMPVDPNALVFGTDCIAAVSAGWASFVIPPSVISYYDFPLDAGE